MTNTHIVHESSKRSVCPFGLDIYPPDQRDKERQQDAGIDEACQHNTTTTAGDLNRHQVLNIFFFIIHLFFFLQLLFSFWFRAQQILQLLLKMAVTHTLPSFCCFFALAPGNPVWHPHLPQDDNTPFWLCIFIPVYLYWKKENQQSQPLSKRQRQQKFAHDLQEQIRDKKQRFMMEKSCQQKQEQRFHLIKNDTSECNRFSVYKQRVSCV